MIFSERTRIFTYIAVLTATSCALANRGNSEMARLLHRPVRALSFPEASTMGIFFALATPLQAPRNSVSMSYFFEAMYSLPMNSSDFEIHTEEGRRKKRRIDRSTIYPIVENKFRRAGLGGRECLLRTICETSEFSLLENGVLGDIIHVVFTPSTSRFENLSGDILEAESNGKSNDCGKYYSDCPVGLFDLIGILA